MNLRCTPEAKFKSRRFFSVFKDSYRRPFLCLILLNEVCQDFFLHVYMHVFAYNVRPVSLYKSKDLGSMRKNLHAVMDDADVSDKCSFLRNSNANVE